MGVLVGCQVLDFIVVVVLGNGEIVENFNLKEIIKGKKVVIFFYLLDFIFVCFLELIVFDKCFEEF